MNLEQQFKIRIARVTEASELTDLALRSKSIWDYDETYIKIAEKPSH